MSAASGVPDLAFPWILRVEEPDVTFDELSNSGEFATLDAKLASSLSVGLTGDLARKVEHAKEKLTLERKMLLKGRQILHMIFDYYKLPEVDGQLFRVTDLLEVKMEGNDLRSFVNAWDNALLVMKGEVTDEWKYALFMKQVDNNPALQYDMPSHRLLQDGHPDKTYEKLRRLVDCRLEQIRRDRMRQDANKRNPPRAMPATSQPKI